MATSKAPARIGEIDWTPRRIRRLRGKRTQTEFGELLGVPKNTVWRWETAYASPDHENARALSRLADDEGFLLSWTLVGSMELVEPLEGATEEIREQFRKSLERTARRLTGLSSSTY